MLAVLATFELHPYVLHDAPSRRLVRSFGLTLVAGADDAVPAAPIPAGLEWLRQALRRADGTRTRGAGGSARDALPARRGHRLAPRCAAVPRGQRRLAADRLPDAVPPQQAPRLGDGRTHPRVPLRVPSVRSDAGTMEAPHPSSHAGAVVDDVPHPAARCSRHAVSGCTRKRMTVHVHSARRPLGCPGMVPWLCPGGAGPGGTTGRPFGADGVYLTMREER